MKIELKNIKYAAFASEETSCYEAALYIDGKKIGVVSNEGHGGPDNFYGDQAAFAKADDWCKANLPKWDMAEYGDSKPRDTSLEMHCGKLLDEHLALKDLRRLLKNRVVFVKPDSKIYQTNTIKAKGPALDRTKAAWIAELSAKNPDYIILNTLPEAGALAYFIGAKKWDKVPA